MRKPAYRFMTFWIVLNLLLPTLTALMPAYGFWSSIPVTRSPSSQGEFTIYGPMNIVRSNGGPSTTVADFSVGQPNAEYFLRILNGGRNNEFGRVSSGRVKLNGVEIVHPNEFGQQVRMIEKQVTLAASNTISMQIASGPGSGISVEFYGIDNEPPGINILSPSDGATVSEPDLTVSGTATDGVSGIASVACNGSAATLTGGSFSCSLQMTLGANQILVSAADVAGNTSTQSVTVTYQQSAPQSQVTIKPDVLFVGETRDVTITAQVPYEGTAPIVTLYRIDSAGNSLIEGVLADDGNNGDSFAGDGVFSLRRVFSASDEGRVKFRVGYLDDGEEILSGEAALKFFGRMSDEQINGILTAHRSAVATFHDVLSSTSDEADAKTQTITQLRQDPHVIAAGELELGVWVLYAPGILGSIGSSSGNIRGGAGTTSAASESVSPMFTSPPTSMCNNNPEPADDTTIDSRKALILSPFFAEEEGLVIKQMLENTGCPNYEITHITDTAANVDAFKNLHEYGTIVITGHGVSFNADLPDIYEDGFGWQRSSGGPVMLVTSEFVGQNSVRVHESDLRAGRLSLLIDAETPGPDYGAYGIMPSFIEYYSENFPNSLVYVGACFSAHNETMANAFLGKGAKTYFGFTRPVSSPFARDTAIELFSRFLSVPAMTTGGENGAFIDGKIDPYCDGWKDRVRRPQLSLICNANTDPAIEAEWLYKPEFQQTHASKFKMLGAQNLTRPIGILNGSFERKFASWRIWGSQSIVSEFDIFRPTDGEKMALVTNRDSWLGISEEVCIPEGTTRIEFDWNLITEEHDSICFNYPNAGQQYLYWYNDTFRVNISGYGTTGYINKNLNGWPSVYDLCPILTPIETRFAILRPLKATGWQRASYDISDFASSVRSGGFRVSTVDAYYDYGTTAVLIDNVRFVVED